MKLVKTFRSYHLIRKKIQPEDSKNIKQIKVEKKISWLCSDKILCLHTIKRRGIKVEEYLPNISSSCQNLSVQVLNKLLSQKLFEEEVGQYLSIHKEHLKLDKENIV